jgi:hypothetical protein
VRFYRGFAFHAVAGLIIRSTIVNRFHDMHLTLFMLHADLIAHFRDAMQMLRVCLAI